MNGVNIREIEKNPGYTALHRVNFILLGQFCLRKLARLYVAISNRVKVHEIR